MYGDKCFVQIIPMHMMNTEIILGQEKEGSMVSCIICDTLISSLKSCQPQWRGLKLKGVASRGLVSIHCANQG